MRTPSLLLISILVLQGCSRKGAQQPTIEYKSASVTYCQAIVNLEKKHALTKSDLSSDVSRRCGILQVEIAKLPTRGVEPRFVEWARSYRDWLHELQAVSDEMSRRNAPDFVAQAMVRSFVRGQKGDPFGEWLDQSSELGQLKRRIQTLNRERERLMGDLAMMYNGIAPKNQQMEFTP